MCYHNTRTLAALRDALLPKLVAGLMQKSLGIGLYTIEAHYEFRI